MKGKKELARRVFRGRVTKQKSFKVEVAKDDHYKYDTIVAPYQPTVEKIAALLAEAEKKGRIKQTEFIKNVGATYGETSLLLYESGIFDDLVEELKGE